MSSTFLSSSCRIPMGTVLYPNPHSVVMCTLFCTLLSLLPPGRARVYSLTSACLIFFLLRAIGACSKSDSTFMYSIIFIPKPLEKAFVLGLVKVLRFLDLYGDDDSVFTDDSYGDGQSTYRNDPPTLHHPPYNGFSGNSPQRWERSFLQSTPDR
jgi:hypothetical protein